MLFALGLAEKGMMSTSSILPSTEPWSQYKWLGSIVGLLSISHTDDDFSRDDIIITFRAIFSHEPKGRATLKLSLPVTAIEPSGEAQEGVG